MTTDIRETNIGPREKRRRFTLGIAMLGIAAIVLVGQIVFGWSKWWRIINVLPFFAGIMGLLQAQRGT